VCQKLNDNGAFVLTLPEQPRDLFASALCDPEDDVHGTVHRDLGHPHKREGHRHRNATATATAAAPHIRGGRVRGEVGPQRPGRPSPLSSRRVGGRLLKFRGAPRRDRPVHRRRRDGRLLQCWLLASRSVLRNILLFLLCIAV
jgi:hypothetical protein